MLDSIRMFCRFQAVSVSLLALASAIGRAATPSAIPELVPHWRYVDLPVFEVLSSCNDGRTQQFMECLYRAIPLMELPNGFANTAQKIQIILCDHPLDPVFAPANAPPYLRKFGRNGGISYAEGDDGETKSIRVSLENWHVDNSSWRVVGLPLHLVPFLVQHHSPQPPEWLRVAVDNLFNIEGDEERTAYVTGATLQWPGAPQIRRQLRTRSENRKNSSR
jgi:hypothetical protein